MPKSPGGAKTSAASQLLNSLQREQRTWSDWSECSEKCVKTRHRMNCDDLIIQNNLQAIEEKSVINDLPLSNSNKINAIKWSQRNKRRRRQALDEQPSAGGEAGEPDDEGVEPEQEVDNCDGLESSKTLEEKACLGGLCPIVSNQQQQNLAAPPRPTPPAGAMVPMPVKVPLGPSQVVHKNQLPPSGSIQSNVGQEVKADGVSWRLQQPTQSLVEHQHELMVPMRAITTSQLQPQQPHNATPSWTKGVWPTQLLGASDLGPQAALVQWTILLGSLLATLLLVLLLVHKLFVALFPSYHWMLAKQTIKTAAKSKARSGSGGSQSYFTRRTSDCDCHAQLNRVHANGNKSSLCLHQPQHHARQAQLCNSLNLTSLTCFESEQLADSNSHLQAWHPVSPFQVQQAASNCQTFRSATSATSSSGYQCVLEPSGEHLLCAGSAKFNTDEPHYVDLGARQEDQHLFHRANQPAIDRRRAFCKQTMMDSSKLAEVEPQQHQVGQNKLQICITNNKHSSPNVPVERRRTSGSQFETEIELEDEQHPLKSESGNSLSEVSSNSVESATAPMLSQANSSSLEQQDQHAELSCSNQPISSSRDIKFGSTSLTNSPATKPIQARGIKTQLMVCESQPSSPNSALSNNQQQRVARLVGHVRKPSLNRNNLDNLDQAGGSVNSLIRYHSAQSTPSNRGQLQQTQGNCDIEDEAGGRHFYEEIDQCTSQQRN